MIIVDTELARRESEGRPIRAGMVGAGFMGSGIALQIITATAGMKLCAIANRRLTPAIGVFEQVGTHPAGAIDKLQSKWSEIWGGEGPLVPPPPANTRWTLPEKGDYPSSYPHPRGYDGALGTLGAIRELMC